MSAVNHDNYHIVELISAADIAKRIDELAEQITNEYADTKQLVVVGLLRGSFIFIADLVRRLDLPVEVDFLETASYGNDTSSSGEVRILKDLRGAIADHDVLVVEDIVDSGLTLQKVLAMLQARQPRKLNVCALLDKPSRRREAVAAQWVGFTIPDEFVVGYGIDYAQRNRNLPFIGKVVFAEG